MKPKACPVQHFVLTKATLRPMGSLQEGHSLSHDPQPLEVTHNLHAHVFLTRWDLAEGRFGGELSHLPKLGQPPQTPTENSGMGFIYPVPGRNGHIYPPLEVFNSRQLTSLLLNGLFKCRLPVGEEKRNGTQESRSETLQSSGGMEPLYPKGHLPFWTIFQGATPSSGQDQRQKQLESKSKFYLCIPS